MTTNDEIKEKIYEDTLNELAKTLLSYKDDNIPAITDIETAVKLAIDKTDTTVRADEREQINESHIATVIELVKQRDYYVEKYDKGKDHSTYQIYLKERHVREESIRQAERQRCIEILKPLKKALLYLERAQKDWELNSKYDTENVLRNRAIIDVINQSKAIAKLSEKVE